MFLTEDKTLTYPSGFCPDKVSLQIDWPPCLRHFFITVAVYIDSPEDRERQDHLIYKIDTASTANLFVKSLPSALT